MNSDAVINSRSPQSDQQPWVRVSTSEGFWAWLAEQDVSLTFTTYQAGKLFLVGRGPEGKVTIFERTFNRCMGLFSQGNGKTLWMGTLFQVWRLENALLPDFLHEGHDHLYVPRIGYTTGDLDVHDIAVERGGRVLFANTRFNCVATLSDRDSFAPVWKPPFTGLSFVEGHAFGFQTVATFTDPGGAELPLDYSANINWGDGSITPGVITGDGTGNFQVRGGHTYAEESSPDHPGSTPYMINVIIGHEDTQPQLVTSPAFVADAPIIATGGFAFNSLEGQNTGLQTLAVFQDMGGTENLSDYSATIDWGDGVTDTGIIAVNGANQLVVQAATRTRRKTPRTIPAQRLIPSTSPFATKAPLNKP